MKPPLLIAIAAMAHNRVIGCSGAIPWRIAEEMAWFKRATMGHAVLMGRKTWDSLPKPLPGRLNLVASRQSALQTFLDWGITPSLSPFKPHFKPKKGEGVQPKFVNGAPQNPDGIVSDLRAFDPARYAQESGGKLFVIGGAQIYAQLLPRCDELWLTELEMNAKGKTLFPEFAPLFRREEELFAHRDEADARNNFTVHRYVRTDAAASPAADQAAGSAPAPCEPHLSPALAV